MIGYILVLHIALTQVCVCEICVVGRLTLLVECMFEQGFCEQHCIKSLKSQQ